MSETTVSTINEKAAEEYFRRGQEAEAKGETTKAMEFYVRALNENPDHEAGCFHLALLCDRHGDDTQAIELYERICTSKPVHLNALVNLAILYEDNSHYEEAHQCLKAVLTTDPNHEKGRLFMKDVESALEMVHEEEFDHRGDPRARVLDIPINDFELSMRSRNCLKQMNLHTLGDLLRANEEDLLSYKNFGETSLNEIKAVLAQKGLRLGQAAGVGKAREADDVENDAAPHEALKKNVSDLELSVRSRKALQRLNINSVGELIARTEDELLGCKNFGQTSLSEIKKQLETMGLSLRKLEE